MKQLRLVERLDDLADLRCDRALRRRLLGAIGVLVLEGLSRVGARTGAEIRVRPLHAALVATAAIAAFVSMDGTRWAWRSLTDRSEHSSLPERAETARMALRVFSDHPWIGVAPGGAGPYYVATYPEDLRAGIRERGGHVGRTWDLAHMPLSHNLATELLSEWGALGTAFFLVGLGFLLRGARGRDLLEVAWVLAIVAASVQTVPRFDLWICLSLVWAGPAPRADGAAGSMGP